MKNILFVGVGVSIVLFGAVALTTFGGKESNNLNTSNAGQTIASQNEVSSAISSEDAQLLTYLDKDDPTYNDMKKYLTGPQFDEFYIANMIHFSEGVEQLEGLASKSSNATLAEGASARAASAKANVAFYKQLQKDKGLLISYGDNMQYHGAMSADTAVYLAVSSLEGLSGEAYDKELIGQLEEFRMNITTIAAVGLESAVDSDVQKLVREELADNIKGLDVIKSVS